MTSYKFQAFELLKLSGLSLTHVELTKQIPNACGETISRALRSLFEKGCVTRSAVDPSKPNGLKKWKVIPNVNYPTRQVASPSQLPITFATKGIHVTQATYSASLLAAVESTVQALVDTDRTFTAYDVTKTLREGVNSGLDLVDKTEVGTTYVNGKTVARIVHEDVKLIVHQAFDDKKMKNYGRTRVDGHDGAWEYKPAQAITPVPPVAYTGTSVL